MDFYLITRLSARKKEFTDFVTDLEFVNHVIRSKKSNLSEAFELKSTEFETKHRMGIDVSENQEELRAMSARLLEITEKATKVSVLIDTLNRYISEIDKATESANELLTILHGVNRGNSLEKIDLAIVNKFNTTETIEEMEELTILANDYLLLANIRDI